MNAWKGTLALLCLIASAHGTDLSIYTPIRAAHHMDANDLAVVINTADPLSVEIGNYYVEERHIPATNVARISFDYHRDILTDSEFSALRADVEAQIGNWVQAYVLTWARPYQVGCMSITSAFAFGVDPKFCAQGCHLTQVSRYFNSTTTRPYDDLRVRPAMSLAAVDFTRAKALIDRGVAADGTAPPGTAYLVATHDAQRNGRAAEYPMTATRVGVQFNVRVIHAESLENRQDVMFYFIGATTVPGLSSNRFLPGAVGDHLTSFGGKLIDSPQMSSLAWLEAGATGSYGTVAEPCNFLQKFPVVPLLLTHYLAGETLIEAYWKSVAMPGQGLFIGEPLAAPFKRQSVTP